MPHPNATPLLSNPDFIADCKNPRMSIHAVATRWSVSPSTAHKYVHRLRTVQIIDGVEVTLAPEGQTADDESGKTTWTGSEGELAVVIHEVMSHENILAKFGHDPQNTRIVGVLEETHWQFGTEDKRFNHRYRFKTQRRDPITGEWPADPTAASGPSWPVVQPAPPIRVEATTVATEPLDAVSGYSVALKFADPQIGFRYLQDDTLDPFHDDSALAIWIEAVRMYRPVKITILGDYLDLPTTSRHPQEAGFARTMQHAINRGYRLLAELRAAAPDAEIVLVEGNHDKRLQNFIESNALAAFGLKRAEMPSEWPVMSLPNLLRLEELDVRYIDAYPAATDWDNDLTRNIHGTKSNSKGSTMSQYVHELPHVNTWAGHTHRLEVIYRTVLGPRGEPIRSYAANPGVGCRVDGAVPSVHGAIGNDGMPARVVEDWQQGFGVLYFNDTESWPEVYRIQDGRAIVAGRVLAA